MQATRAVPPSHSLPAPRHSTAPRHPAYPAEPTPVTALRPCACGPSREYTRVTFELTQAIPFRARLIDNPNRVILDLEGLEVESKVRELLGKISTNDPFVRQVRVGQFNPRPCASSST